MISLKGSVVCLLLLCFQSAHGKCARLNKTDELIVGGKPAPSPIPYQVYYRCFLLIFILNCGGAIISPHHVLTAAHCIIEGTFERTVRAGSIYTHSGGFLHKVAWAKRHPKFNDKEYHDDIGILRIEGTFFWSRDVQPIAFNSKKFYPGGELVWVSGWGRIDQNATVDPESLQYLAQRTMDNKNCKRFWTGIDDGHICAFTRYGCGFCKGDSGGPLVNAEKNMLIGIVSYGSKICGDGKPNVYTRVSSYVDWIENTILENTMHNCV